MIKITCLNNNVNERRYIIETLFTDLLGLGVEICFSNDVRDYIIEYGDKKILIKDDFFSKFTEPLSYLSKVNIPNKAIVAKSLELNKTIIIYGEDVFQRTDDALYCGIDIFASSFFMLTRWEEFLLGRETKGVCPEEDLLAVKSKIEKRPVVNEYLELLIDLLQQIGLSIQKPNKYEVLLTHDVDRCYLSSFSTLMNNLIPLAFKQKQYKKAVTVFFRFIRYKLQRTNPFDPFVELMDYSDKYGLKNHFYFKATEKNETGSTYSLSDSVVKRMIDVIKERKHYIGFHPSEHTFDNDEQFRIEYQRLKDRIGDDILKGGRNHSLLYKQDTMKQWERAFEYDSGFGYQHRNGFRCGVCFPFRVFHINNREVLDLWEIPFIAMDSVALRNKWTPEAHQKDVCELTDVVKKYNGIICLNWHSNLFNVIERKEHKSVYFEVIKHIYNGK